VKHSSAVAAKHSPFDLCPALSDALTLRL
jgi:hypothetical protein